VEEMNATGMKAQPLVEQKAPAIGAVHGLRENSRVRPDPAAHLIAEQEIAAQQQGVDDDLDVVGDSDEDAKAAAKDTAKTEGDTATAKTAIGGISDVDVAEA
jgi:phosphoglycolate phosphatase-like HAD superfamily hydrolase